MTPYETVAIILMGAVLVLCIIIAVLAKKAAKNSDATAQEQEIKRLREENQRLSQEIMKQVRENGESLRGAISEDISNTIRNQRERSHCEEVRFRCD